MTELIVNSRAVAEWVARRTGVTSADEFGPCASIGVGRNGRPLAGFVFNWYRQEPFGNDIRVTLAAEPGTLWAKHDVLRFIARYIFEQLGCCRVTVMIREGNLPSERLAKKLGFRKEGVLRRAFDGRSNALIYGLLKSECRWLNE